MRSIPGGGQCPQDSLDDAVAVLEDFVIPEAQHTVTLRRQERGSRLVIANVLLLTVMVAVELDDQFAAAAGEVRDNVADAELAAKVMALPLQFAQLDPQLAFGRRAELAKRAGAGKRRAHA